MDVCWLQPSKFLIEHVGLSQPEAWEGNMSTYVNSPVLPCIVLFCIVIWISLQIQYYYKGQPGSLFHDFFRKKNVSFKHQGTRIYPPMITVLDQNYIFIIICWLVASRLVISLVTRKRGQLKQSCRRKRCACSRTTLHNHESSEPRTDVKCNLSTLHARVSYRHLIYLSAHRQANGRPHGLKNCFKLHRLYWSNQ